MKPAMSGEKIQPGKSDIKLGSVADLITIYYQTAAFLQLADATRQTYRGILERFRAEYGERPVAFLEEQHILAILDKRAATPAAANHLRRLLRAIMKLAKKRKMITVNPMTEVEPIRYKVKGYKDWSDLRNRDIYGMLPARNAGAFGVRTFALCSTSAKRCGKAWPAKRAWRPAGL